MKNDRTSELIMKHLDGSLSDEEQAEFAELFASDPKAGKLLYELSLQQTMLYRIGAGRKIGQTFSEKKKNPVFSALTTAAAILIGVSLMLFFSFRDTDGPAEVKIPLVAAPSYPEIQVAGNFTVIGGETARRNSIIRTEETTNLVLGNYCRIEAGPETEFRIEGKPFAESLYLEAGELICDINSNVGTFSVETEAGTVHVTGTRFLVRVSDVKGEEMKVKEMFVRVMMGAVLIAGAAGDAPLLEGQEANVRRGDGAQGGGRDMGRMFTQMSGRMGGGGGSMVSSGDDLFVLTGAKLARVDMKTYKIAAEINLSDIGKEEAAAQEAALRKEWIKRFDKNDDGKITAADGEFQGQWMSRFDKNNDSELTEDEVPVNAPPTKAASGTAVLTIAGEDLCLLRNGILFIFGKTDLVFKKSLTIDEGDDENKANTGFNMMRGMKPGGEKPEGAKDGGEMKKAHPGDGAQRKHKKDAPQDDHAEGAVF